MELRLLVGDIVMFTKRRRTYKSKKILLLCLMLCCCVFMCSCTLGNWTYDKLPNDYEIWYFDSENIDLAKVHSNGNGGSIIIDGYISAFCYNDQYIGIIRISKEKTMDGTTESITEYYLINTSADEVFGPYELERYESYCEELGIEDMGEWINTNPRPEGAK